MIQANCKSPHSSDWTISPSFFSTIFEYFSKKDDYEKKEYKKDNIKD